MKPEVLRFAIYAQVCLYLGLMVCIAIRPAGLAANGGISYYGIYKQTIFPFSIALAGSALFTIRAGLNISNQSIKVLRVGLISIGGLTLGVLLTPDSLSHFFDGLHRGFGSTLFILQILISFWFSRLLNYSMITILLILAEFIGGIASLIYLAPAHGLLIQAQIFFQLAFGALLIYSLPKLAAKPN